MQENTNKTTSSGNSESGIKQGPDEALERKYQLLRELDGIIIKLEELLKLQEQNYEPYKERQTKAAIRALLNIRGFTNLKSFHKGDEQ